ncbi:MAG TPA: hypothetical protein VLQ48_02880 [Chloroflexia bacterium]|nr:hypothetical protein [Chloroflexia bacterium]
MEQGTLFNQRLAEAIAWCNIHASIDKPATSLRSPELNPIAPGSEVEVGAKWEGEQGPVETLVALRSRRLREMEIYPTLPAAPLNDGRLLVYFPYANLTDGTAADVSMGFLDGLDAPPWDTWVWFGYDPGRVEPSGDYSDAYYLVAWIPQMFVALVDAGIRVSLYDLFWLSDMPDLALPIPH